MDANSNQWRTAAVSLACLLVLLCIAWVMREQTMAEDRRREREQWEQIEGGRRLMDEERSRLIERLDSALDEMRRKEHHRTHPTTGPGLLMSDRIAAVERLSFVSSGQGEWLLGHLPKRYLPTCAPTDTVFPSDFVRRDATSCERGGA
jgi:hypothetical protein